MKKRTKALGLLAIAAGVGGALATRKASARWRAEADPCEGDVNGMAWPDKQTVTTDDGARIATYVAGPADGPVAVLAHGWTNRASTWSPVARRLVAKGFKVIAYDQRGHGASTTGSAGVAPSRLGDDLLAVLNAYDVRDAVIAGHSMGGMTIQAFAIDHPAEAKERARAFVLVATAAHGLKSPLEAGLASPAVNKLVNRTMAGPAGPYFVRGAVGRTPRWNHLVELATLFAETDATVRADCVTAMGAMDLRPGLGTVDIPTVVAIGARDGLTREPLGRAIAAGIPGARTVVFPDAGHMLQWEHPDEIADLIASEAKVPAGATA